MTNVADAVGKISATRRGVVTQPVAKPVPVAQIVKPVGSSGNGATPLNTTTIFPTIKDPAGLQGQTLISGKYASLNYQNFQYVASGGMGHVYSADVIDQQGAVRGRCAIKIINDYHPDDKRLRLFQTEIEAMLRLNQHPHIVHAVDYGFHDKLPFVVMPYISDGVPLNEVKMPAPKMAHILADIASALGYAQGVGFAHLDLKPPNILVSKAKEIINGSFPERLKAYLTDFGLSRNLDISTNTMTGTVKGTVHYMAPEIFNGVKGDGISDLFSFGVILYEMFCGNKPFAADTVNGVMGQIMKGDYELPNTESGILNSLITRLLTTDRRERTRLLPSGFRSVESDLRVAAQELESDPLKLFLKKAS